MSFLSFFFLSVREKTFASMMPDAVEAAVAISVGRNMDEASALPADARIAMTVAGTS